MIRIDFVPIIHDCYKNIQTAQSKILCIPTTPETDYEPLTLPNYKYTLVLNKMDSQYTHWPMNSSEQDIVESLRVAT